MNSLKEFDFNCWDPIINSSLSDQVIAALEGGQVVVLPHLAFNLLPEEERFLSSIWSDKKAKNISLRPNAGLRGATGSELDMLALRGMIDIVLNYGTIIDMNTKHKKVLKNIFETPIQSSIVWKDIESMLVTLGADISEGNGSRVRIALNGVRAVFHRPHPKKETDKGAVVSLRRFLKEAGVKPC